MSGPNSQIFESYVPVYDTVPESWEEAREFLVEHLKKISQAVNIREIGWWLDEELLSGKQLFPSALPSLTGTSQQYRQILRKVVDFGPLPVTGSKRVAHGILFDDNFTLIQLFAAATDITRHFAIPIPYVELNTNLQVQILIDNTYVYIITTGTFDFSVYTRCIVTIEYTQEL